jgi:molybdopterin-guanine dinucleotide biosynthesis protein A
MTRERCTGVILAGGGATRYGGVAKGLKRVGGSRIIDRVAAALREAADDLLLIANDAAASTWLPGVRLASDLEPGLGSLGGIQSALAHAGAAVLVVAWDMPFVPASLLCDLRETAERERADVVIPESGSKRGVEPLCAYYGPACAPAIAASLAVGDRRVVGFFERVRVVRLSGDRVTRHGDPSRIFLNVNTPAELAAAEAHVGSTDGDGDRPEE